MLYQTVTLPMILSDPKPLMLVNFGSSFQSLEWVEWHFKFSTHWSWRVL